MAVQTKHFCMGSENYMHSKNSNYITIVKFNLFLHVAKVSRIFISFSTLFFEHFGHITVTGRVTGQSRSAPEGVWVQGGGVEIPCNYEVSIENGLKKLRKDLKRQILLLKSNNDGTV